MRLRRNWQGEAKLPAMPGVLGAEPEVLRAGWSTEFGGIHPVHVEIGMGKGEFLLTMAEKNPDVDFIGVERVLTVLYIAAEKYQKKPLTNLRFLSTDARALEYCFLPGQVDRIYLNFSDPWPKQRHAQRRLTAAPLLAAYRRILAPGGQLHLKTDQERFFDFSLGELVRGGWSVGKINRDLHASGFDGNIETEYERRFLRQGQPIYRLEAWNGHA